MLWAFASALLGLWVLGLATDYTMEGAIHGLLAAALVLIIVQLIRGRKPKAAYEPPQWN